MTKHRIVARLSLRTEIVKSLLLVDHAQQIAGRVTTIPGCTTPAR